ncbi:hypothetical protein JCM11491_003401 [Sporobolomyces phaffii]
MSTRSQSAPPSPTASVNSFETCSTLNAIASLDPARLSSESAPGALASRRTPSPELKNTTASDEDEGKPDESANDEVAVVDRDSLESHVPPLEPNSPSNSNEPIRNAAASFGRRSSIAGVADETNSMRRRSPASSIQSDHKGSSTGHPTDSTGHTYRDDEARSIKSVDEDKGALQLPVVSPGYPPRQPGPFDSDPFVPPDGGIRAYLNVVGGFLVLFATFGYTNAWGVYQAYYSQTIYRTHSDSAIAWIGSVQLCLFFLMALVAGPLFDKGMFRYLLAAGSAVQTASVFLVPQCGEFWQTMVVQGVMSGIGIGLSFLPALSIQSHWFERRRAFAIGIVTCGSSIGGIAFPIMLNKLFANRDVGFTDGVRASGYVVAACLLVANLIMAPHPARLRANKPPLPPLRKIMTPTFACMTGGAFLLNWGLWMPLFYLQLFAQSKGVSSNLSFYTLAIYNAGSVFGRTIPNLAADYLGPQNIQSFSCVSAGIVLYCMYACESAASIVTFAAIYGFLSGAFISLVSPAIISISDDISEIGLRQGVAFLIVAGGAVGGNPVCGKLLGLASRTDPFLAPIAFAGTMALLGGVVTTVGRFLRAKEKGTWKV